MARRRSHRHTILSSIQIEKIGHGGIGIAHHHDGKTILVSGGILPGSIIDAKVLRSRKDHITAQCIAIHDIGAQYSLTDVQCPHYFFHPGDQSHNHKVGCGGCKWQIVPYAQQLILKHQVIVDTFHPLQDIVDQAGGIPPVLGSPQSFGYRNKIEYSFGKFIVGKKGGSGPEHHSQDHTEEKSLGLYTHQDRNLGFHKQGLFSKIVDVDACLLTTPQATRLYQYLKQILKNSGLPVYDAKTHEGFLRHLVIRQGINTDQYLVNIVTTSASQVKYQGDIFDMSEKRNQVQDILKQDPELRKQITSMCITYNDGLGDTVRSVTSQTIDLRGPGYIHEILQFDDQQVRFQISPFAFFQTNTHGAELLFATAMHMIDTYQGTILDLYCGAGSIGISMLKSGIGHEVIGIEIVPEAIQDAQINAKLNECDQQCYFVAGKAENLIYSDPYLAQTIAEVGLVIVDPPRDGLHPDVIKFLCELKAKQDYKLLYISCNPVTLCRDIGGLQGSFEIHKLQAVDMFPHTHHCEMIALMN